MDLNAGTLVEGYRVVRLLGSGSMGEVHEATDAEGHPVALKFIRFGPTRDRDALLRFQREAKVCATLASPHLVPVTGYGVFRDVPFLVMPKLVGRTLADWLAQTGALEPSVAVTIAIEAGRGLATAHTAGVVHRDLTPSNIFLCEHGPNLRVVLCDFGLAKIVDEDGTLTASGDVLGTPVYMAPEQLFDSKRVDARTDVWALGMTLYHALAGRSAFHGAKGMADLTFLLHKCLEKSEVPSLQEVAPWIEPALARVVHAALLPLDARIASVEELVAALGGFASPARAITPSALVEVSEEVRAQIAARAELPKTRADVAATAGALGIDVTVRDRDPDSRSANLLGGRYRLHGKLGVGARSAALYDADDVMTGRSVTVELLSREGGALPPENVHRFLRRARAIEAIDSPHLTKVLGAGVDAATGAAFVVTDRSRGQHLSDVLVAHGRLAPETAVSLIVEACEGIAAAHAAGVVHGDIKPAALFVEEKDDGEVELKVRDFGLSTELSVDAAASSVDRARTAPMHGSSVHLSPEQASGQVAAPRSDVWGLSLSLYEALTGASPWAGIRSRGELIIAVCTQDVPSLSAAAPWVEPALASVIHRGLARDPQARFATAGDLAAALRPFGLVGRVRLADLVPVSRRAPRTSAIPADDSPIELPTRRSPLLLALAIVALAAVGAVTLALLR